MKTIVISLLNLLTITMYSQKSNNSFQSSDHKTNTSIYSVNDTKIINRGINFGFNEITPTKESESSINELADYLAQNKDVKIEVGVFTSAIGPDRYNLKLSQKRAESCKELLVAKGITSDRIIAKGYGESRLLNDCPDIKDCDMSEHNVNERVEIKFI